jgi:hypothetical protein
MIAALRTGTAHTVLRQLSVLGARIECRGDKMVLRVGVRPVPPELIAAARASKAELAKMLTVAEGAHQRKDEHLRPAAAANPGISAAFSEGAQSCENDHLREPLNAFGEAGDFRGSPPPKGSPAPAAVPKMLTEDAQVRTFERVKDFCGFQSDSTPKARNSPHVSTFGSDEHLRRTWGEAEKERAAISRIGIAEIPDEPVLLRDGRRLWRFSQAQNCTPDRASALIDQAHWCGAVLVADGRELIVVENWLSSLPVETLCELNRCASGVIAALHRQPLVRCQAGARRRGERWPSR